MRGGMEMPNPNSNETAAKARVIFERMKESLEQTHANQFVAIEPISGEPFFGKTLSEAIGAARKRFPTRLTHTFRVGHRAAVHFGLHIR
jgi:hypothetical protein